MTARTHAAFPLILLAAVLAALAWSGIAPYDRAVWWAEVMPVLIAAPLLAATWRRFPFTPLAYGLIAFFALILILGGAYTYARVPLGDWLRDALDLARNPYDRIGHFFQGVTPAIVARELLLRTSPLRPGKWLFFLVLCVALAISASYELVEWASAVFWGDGSVEFLGTQGDPWDAQWDMFTALIGAALAQLLLARLHDRQIAALPQPGKP
jgi:putative membrane protein